jgi:light-regulated signal transduction histidine kinase (bacteriophytochrome)
MSSSSKAIAACALILLICIGALSFWSEVRNGKEREWVTRALLVVEKLQAVRIDISQAKIRLQKPSLQTTSLDSLVRPAVEDLNRAYSGRKIDWQAGDLFDVKCDPGLMKQVFVNLLSNAVKYTARQEHAVIQVGQMGQGHELVVFVRDNGVGFDMKYAR